MTDDDAKMVEELREMASRPFAEHNWTLNVGLALIGRLQAENARLAAEVERLTPREMTNDEIVATLNKHKARGASFWEYRNNHDGPAFLFMASEWDDVVAYSLDEARYVAQSLERDAAMKETAR